MLMVRRYSKDDLMGAGLTKDDRPQPPLPDVLPQRNEEEEAKYSAPHYLLIQVTLRGGSAKSATF